MRNIVLARIDERLIHGQIATSWLKIKANPNYILIVDNKLVNDAMQKRLFQNCHPLEPPYIAGYNNFPPST